MDIQVNQQQPEKSLFFPLSNIMKRWITGLSLGAICTLWIYSGNGPFTLGFLLTSLIAQSEYYTMVKATGVLPAHKTGILSSIICYFAAALYPTYHELVMPLSTTLMMVWLLIFNKKSASISEISTSFLGMFYLGYLPSFWVRLRSIESSWITGTSITWWTWTSIVCAGNCYFLFFIFFQFSVFFQVLFCFFVTFFLMKMLEHILLEKSLASTSCLQ
jgi:hypothetical protein